jgi:leader peptidase (prepilin peptidase) / N-methyltransferase
VELITGIMYLALFLRYGVTVEFLMSIYIMSVLLVVFFIDMDHKIIPNGLVIAGIIGGLPFVVYNFFIPVHIYGKSNWWEPFAGIIPGTVFLLIVMLAGYFIYKSDEVMGMGDVKIFIPIGLFLGWRLCVIALLASVVSGGLIGLVLMISGRKNRKDTIAFAPFITAGTFIALMWGHDLINWYFNRLG